MERRFHRNEKGSLLVMSIIILLVMTISIPAMVNWVRQETKDTVKIKRSTAAFHLAEAGVDQGIWKLQESQTTWTAAKNATAIADYDGSTQFSLTLNNGKSGKYTVRFSSGPSTGQVTILAKGRDDSTKEIRAIQAVMEENGAGEYSIQAKKTSSFGAATSVEWGPIMSKVSIDSGGKNHPRLLSAGDVTGKDTNAGAAPNTDSIQWWSYKTDLPPDPSIDFVAYQASATASGSAPDGCGNDASSTYYRAGNATFKGCTDMTQQVYYITGNCDFASGSGGNQIKADIICLGDLGVSGNGGGNMTETLSVPSEAWKEYGNDWTYYTTNFDPACPHATFAAAAAADYAPTGLTKSVSDIVVHGFLYSGGSQGLTGGGNGVLVGTLYSANNASLTTSNCTLYYDPVSASSVQTTNVIITRASWKELAGQSFP
jgi:Tfp pilus assembly protein PilX